MTVGIEVAVTVTVESVLSAALVVTAVSLEVVVVSVGSMVDVSSVEVDVVVLMSDVVVVTVVVCAATRETPAARARRVMVFFILGFDDVLFQRENVLRKADSSE